MFKKKLLIDVALFVVIVFALLWFVPFITRMMKQLIVLEVIIVIAGAIGLRILVNKIRKKYQEPESNNRQGSRKQRGASEKEGKEAD